jgi:hypothetical protein
LCLCCPSRHQAIQPLLSLVSHAERSGNRADAYRGANRGSGQQYRKRSLCCRQTHHLQEMPAFLVQAFSMLVFPFTSRSRLRQRLSLLRQQQCKMLSSSYSHEGFRIILRRLGLLCAGSFICSPELQLHLAYPTGLTEFYISGIEISASA